MRFSSGRDCPPPTPFGYTPPPEAIALGWVCGAGDCGRRGTDALVARWPRSCPDCGHPVATDELADPWQHAARRVEIDARLIFPRHPDDPLTATADDLQWQIVDALRRRQPELAEHRRRRLGAFLAQQEATGRLDGGQYRWSVVQQALAHHAVDLAVRELAEWHRTTDLTELAGHPARRTNCRRLVAELIASLEQPGLAAAPGARRVWEMLAQLTARVDDVATADHRRSLDRLRRVMAGGAERAWPRP